MKTALDYLFELSQETEVITIRVITYDEHGLREVPKKIIVPTQTAKKVQEILNEMANQQN